jgi:hypothetical protein
VAATTSATGRLAIYGTEIKDLSAVDLSFNLSGAVKQSTPANTSTDELSDFLELVEDGNKATVYLREGVTMASLIAALVGNSFNLNVVNGADTVVTDVVTIGGPGSDIQMTTNSAAPVINSPASATLVDGSIVYQASASDANGAGLFRYSISGPDSEFFTIDASTGAVRVKTDLTDTQQAQYLSRSDYSVDISVTDGVLGVAKSSTSSIVIDRPEVDQKGGLIVVATTEVGGNTTNDTNAVVEVTQTPVAASQMPSGVSMPYGRSEIFATQEVDLGTVPTSFSMYVDASANVNGFWATVNGELVNLASAEMGGSLNPIEGTTMVRIDLDLAVAQSELGHSFISNGDLLLNGAPAHVDFGNLGANPMQLSSLFWS